MATRAKYEVPGALGILEEAVFLLRSAAGVLLPAYYIGSLPFVLGLFYFWADMSRAADAYRHIHASAFGMALLYAWMKCWQAVFAIRLRRHLLGDDALPWPLGKLADLIGIQVLVHATAIVILPAALLLTLPFGWCYAFYQNVTAAPAERYGGIGDLCRHAWRQAALWPRQNHLVLGIMLLFAVAVVMNLAAALFTLPHVIKMIGGFESIFTLSGVSALNTTFLATVLGLTYLCVDPIMKAAYTLRCFYGESLVSGTDIRMELYQCIARQRSASSPS